MDWWSFSFCVGIKCVEFMDYVKNYLGADKGKNIGCTSDNRNNKNTPYLQKCSYGPFPTEVTILDHFALYISLIYGPF